MMMMVKSLNINSEWRTIQSYKMINIHLFFFGNDNYFNIFLMFYHLIMTNPNRILNRIGQRIGIRPQGKVKSFSQKFWHEMITNFTVNQLEINNKIINIQRTLSLFIGRMVIDLIEWWSDSFLFLVIKLTRTIV